MIDKLELIYEKYQGIDQQLQDPNVFANLPLLKKLNKEYKDLSPIVAAYHQYTNILANVANCKEILQTEKDAELLEMAKMEMNELFDKRNQIETDIKTLLVPKDETDSRNVILEIRAGTGGDEASIFAGDLYRMYSRYCEQRGWKVALIDQNEGTAGGYKEVILNIEGEEVYGQLKYESGVHRVQRVPATETQGRIHTSAASVVVLPEAEELDVEINMNDVRKDTFCSSGAGGQSVNTTYSAVRLTHTPTGIVAQCQDERSQLKNFEKCLKVLRSRIYEAEMQKRNEEATSQRKTMVITGDRSAKIRTYNYPQSRVTDHRINLTSYNLPYFVNGDIQEFIDALQLAENAERLAAVND